MSSKMFLLVLHFASHTLRYIKTDTYYHGVPVGQLVAHDSRPGVTEHTQGKRRFERKSFHTPWGNFSSCFQHLFLEGGGWGCKTWLLHGWHILERVHGLEFTEGLDRGDVFLLGASPHACLAFLRFLSLYQRLLLRGLHAPGHHGRVNSCCAVHLLVFGGSYIWCLDS